MMTVRKCRHCGHGKVNRPRGLCWTCFYTPGLRDLYPSTSKFAKKSAKRKGGEQTIEEEQAEVDRTIAEQMRNLPAWWHR